jgi:DNA polymerase-3 subunit epsilon
LAEPPIGNFVAIDVETANEKRNSICQIGVVQFKDGAIADCWETLVADKLHDYLNNSVVAHHSSFDKTAINAVHKKYRIPVPTITWLDTAQVVRRTWKSRSRRGFGLKPVAKMLGIDFQHHNALEDAIVAGKILLHAIDKTGCSVDDGVVVVEGLQKLSLDHEVPGTTGLLDGKTFVLTGSLPCLSRKEASELISLHGGKVVSSVSLRTDFVIVGTGPGSKLKKAQELGVETIDEEDLREMIRS